MKDTSDMMEDTFSEDTMMECSGDDAGLDDLVDLTDEISHSAPTIRDAAERLLTLLGVEGNDDDDLSSSEDEGVELDEDSDDDNDLDDDDEPQNTRLLHQLAASLAQELKYSQKQVNNTSTRLGMIQRGTKTNHEIIRGHMENQVQCMEIGHDSFYKDDAKITKCGHQVDQTLQYKSGSSKGYFISSSLDTNASISSGKFRTDTRLRMGDHVHDEGKTVLSVKTGISDSWSAGWDACAAEAVRYLVEDEGLSPHHPTVIAMKNHLEIQRERALTQYAV